MNNKRKIINKVGNLLLNIFYYSSIGLILLIVLRVFMFSSFKIPTDSMEPSIIPGDYILVNKMAYGARIFNIFDAIGKNDVNIKRVPGYTKIKRNDIMVFHMPYPYSRNKMDMNMLKYYIKRCIGVSGDTLRIVDGFYFINSDSVPLYGNLESEQLLSNTHTDLLSPKVFHAFPKDSILNWNIKDFGPLYIPRKGDVIELNRVSSVLYKNIIEWEKNSTLVFNDDVLYENNVPITKHTFTHNYYFMGGDKVENSQDSRYWGLLPDDFIVGKALYIWKSVNPYSNKINWKRTMIKVE